MCKETDIDYCNECGGFIKFDTRFVLTSSPEKYKGTCKSCGNVTYAFCSDVIRHVEMHKGNYYVK